MSKWLMLVCWRAKNALYADEISRAGWRGFTLIELLVSLAVLSTLAMVALPYAEHTVQRQKEMQLRQALREIRNAIDRCHQDWLDKKISSGANTMSDDGYPKSLDVLVSGIERADVGGGKIKYLRRIPVDPFGIGADKTASGWLLRGYQDDPETTHWNGRDVYDVHSRSERMGSDQRPYKAW